MLMGRVLRHGAYEHWSVSGSTMQCLQLQGRFDTVAGQTPRDAGSNVPDPSYSFFMDNLLETVRDSIADCVEVSYKSMKLDDAAKMMKFESNDELRECIQGRREDWIVEGDSLTFQPPPMESKAVDIPSMNLISQTISYATELERIV